MDQILFYISVYVPPLLFAITLHEAAHGYAARYFGDNTAYVLGRISLNPTRHIDPIGTLALPGLLIALSSPFVFGWAKPVPVSIGNLRNPKRDMIYVAAAGPAANLVMALLWALLLKFYAIVELDSDVLITMALMGVKLNVILMLFNLLPVPPLDGGRILIGLLPMKASLALARIEPYGMFIVLGLLLIGGLDVFLSDWVIQVVKFFLYLVGL
ncbi:MAG: site-2 protease family protein [Pelistega sp.]|nr:site-2 protease family protein [Pelistega sp.]